MNKPKNSSDKTHFGFQEIPVTEKTEKVAGVFHSVAGKYDLMNDLMSLGVHRLWKKHAINALELHPGQTVLDLAGGTGDLSMLISSRVGAEGKIILADINASMLAQGRDRLLNKGLQNISIVQANAECLPFADDSFDRIIMGFGLRNVTDKDAALRSMFRVLKPGGRCMVLEFSKPTFGWLRTLYDQYSFKLLPKLGEWIAKDAASYQYLAESIRMHPDQETLKNMMKTAGFENCTVSNLSGGIVAIHAGFKF